MVVFDILPYYKERGLLQLDDYVPPRECSGRFYIVVVGCTAVHSGPSSYSQTGSTFRTAGGNTSAARVGSRGHGEFLVRCCLTDKPSRYPVKNAA